ncbi:MAG: hypothetical protein AAF628_07930 [Planctomycetota bacterium]
MRRLILAVACGLTLSASSAAQTRYTPTEFTIILHGVELSTDGTTWVEVFADAGGLAVDLTDPNAFSNAFGAAVDIPAGTYSRVRMTLSTTLEWSYPSAPVSLSNQQVTVSGPPGPQAGQMTAYFATHDAGGRPNGTGDGTATSPLLLGQPVTLTAGSDSVLRVVFSVTDTLVDQGGGSFDLGPPLTFFVAENGSASSFAGTYNAVLYNTVKESSSGSTVAWSFRCGHGQLAFDGNGQWTWTGATNTHDLLTTSGAIATGVTRRGNYGVNDDGSFWMITVGEPGTLHGARSADGRTLFASMYDSQTSHMMVFGVERATAGAVSAFSGGYYFSLYGSSYESSGNDLTHRSSFGVVNGDGTGFISGTEDTNRLIVDDPTGSAPTITPPVAATAQSLVDTVTVTTAGELGNTGGVLGGGLLQSGDVGCFAFDFSSPYRAAQEFGFFVRQSPAGTFTAASLDGTYYGGHFGDVFSSSGGSSQSEMFSGFFVVVFDGQGSATVTVLENREGAVESRTLAQNYSVDSASGVVAFSDVGGGTSELMGAIGPDARSFVLTARQETSGSASEQRFLGLGLLQQ